MLKKLPKRACPELAEGFNRSFIVRAPHATKLWLLYAVLFVFNVLIFAVVRWEIYSFLEMAKKGKGKALLQTLVLVLVKRYANVLLPKQWNFLFAL